MRRLGFFIGFLLCCLNIAAQTEKVKFSASGGFYEDVFDLSLSCNDFQHQIRYTINGNRPTSQSKLYTAPLTLDERQYSQSDIYTIVNCPEDEFYLADSVRHCIVIRAAVFDENDSCISPVTTNSYFIRSLGCDTHGLPAVSLCADSIGLFSYYSGIFIPGAWQSPSMPLWTGNYFNKGMEWERRCNVEFYEQNNTGINQEAGLRTHGGASRRYQQKGMKIYAREEYGKKRFKHAFFDDTPINDIKHMVFKPFRCSNWLHTGFNDCLSNRIARKMNMEVQGSRIVALYLNGEYWGIYFAEEKADERYLEDHYGLLPDSCTIIKKWNELETGNDANWWQLYHWMESTDLSSNENYETLSSWIDIDNFIDYQIFQIFSANVDWPANNVLCWQAMGSRWRWMFHDGDGCFFRDWDAFANAVDVSDNINPSNAFSTLFFRRLLKNESFLEQFNGQFIYQMDQALDETRTLPIFYHIVATMQEEIPNQSERFMFPSSFERWQHDSQIVEEFLKTRKETVMQQLAAFIQFYSGLDEAFSLMTEVYPNPFRDQINLNVFAKKPFESRLCLYNMNGICVYQEHVNLPEGYSHISFNPTVPSGLYFLRIGNTTARVIKM